MNPRATSAIAADLISAYQTATADTERFIAGKCRRGRFYRRAGMVEQATAAEFEAVSALLLWRSLAGELRRPVDDERLLALIPSAAIASAAHDMEPSHHAH